MQLPKKSSILYLNELLQYIQYVREKSATQLLVPTMLVIVTAIGANIIAISLYIIRLN